MMTTVEFLDAIKAHHGLASDYKLGMVLELSDSAVGHYRKGRARFDDRTALKVAELLEIEPAYVMACVHAERSLSMGNPELADVWAMVAGKFAKAEKKAMSYARAAAVAAFALFLSVFWGSGPDGGALASPMKTGVVWSASQCNGLCIMLTNPKELHYDSWTLAAASRP